MQKGRDGMSFTQEVGKRIRDRRIKLNLSQDELAKKLGYKDRSSITRIENGERDLPQSKVVAIANALSTTPGYIMGWEQDEPPIDLDVIAKAVEIARKSTENEQIRRLTTYAKKLSQSDLDRLIEIAKMWSDNDVR